MDEALENIKYQTNHIVNLANEFTKIKIEDSEKRLKSMIQLYDDRLQDTRVENAHYSIGLEKKSEELSRLIKNVYEIKADIFKRVKDEMTNVKGEQRTMLKLVSSYKKEFGQIKDKFIQLSEFIRDVRFRVNIAPELQKKEFIAFSKKLSYNYKDKDNNRSSFSGFNGSGRKSMINRADTFNFKNKNFLNSGSDINDIFDSPYFNSKKNKQYPNTLELQKRNSMQINNFNKLSNKVITKFDASKEKEKDNSKINSNEKSENNFGRRKTEALSTPKNLSKDFPNQSDKKEKEKERNDSIKFSSDSSGEENPKQKSKEKEKDKKNQFIIKEEDENENNMSEITEEHNRKKTIKENKISDENENKESIIINEEENQKKKKKKTKKIHKN